MKGLIFTTILALSLVLPAYAQDDGEDAEIGALPECMTINGKKYCHVTAEDTTLWLQGTITINDNRIVYLPETGETETPGTGFDPFQMLRDCPAYTSLPFAAQVKLQQCGTSCITIENNKYCRASGPPLCETLWFSCNWGE